MSIRITLDERDFRDLVAGRIARPEQRNPSAPVVEITLSDIGWLRMQRAITEAQRELAPVTDREDTV